MAKATQPGKEELGFRPRSSDPRWCSCLPPPSPVAWGCWEGEGAPLDWGLTQMQVLLSTTGMSECSALAQGAKKNRRSLPLCKAPDLSVLALCTLLRGPETAHALESGRARPASQLHLF